MEFETGHHIEVVGKVADDGESMRAFLFLPHSQLGEHLRYVATHPVFSLPDTFPVCTTTLDFKLVERTIAVQMELPAVFGEA